MAESGDQCATRSEPIEGIRFTPCQRFTDERSWLIELFRDVEIPVENRPRMAYVSDPSTRSGTKTKTTACIR